MSREPPSPDRADRTLSPILAASTRVMLPVLALVALVIALQGHNKPGGGFIGGLMLAAGVVLQAIAFGPAEARRLLRANPITITVCGLTIALASGLFSPSVGLLHGQWTSLSVHGLETLKLGTPMLFDLGVFLVVVGGSSLMILTLLEGE